MGGNGRKMKKSLLILSILLISNNSFGQLIETMGSLGVQGAMTTSAVNQTRQMNKAVQIDTFLREFNDRLMMIKIDGLNGYKGNYTISTGGYKADFKTINTSSFQVSIPLADKALCERMVARSWDGLRQIQIGNKTYDASMVHSLGFEICPQKTSLKFIFE